MAKFTFYLWERLGADYEYEGDSLEDARKQFDRDYEDGRIGNTHELETEESGVEVLGCANGSGEYGTRQFLEAKWLEISRDPEHCISGIIHDSVEIQYAVNADGNVTGGRVWVQDPYCCWCLTESHLFATHCNTVVTSELFGEGVRDIIVKVFSESFASVRGTQG